MVRERANRGMAGKDVTMTAKALPLNKRPYMFATTPTANALFRESSTTRPTDERIIEISTQPQRRRRSDPGI